MSERNAALAEVIATGIEHIAKGLRQWAQVQRDRLDRPNAIGSFETEVHRVNAGESHNFCFATYNRCFTYG